MITLEWFGQIGWELWLSEIKRELKDSSGEDLTIRFSSIGGNIIEGSGMFNLLADHRRDNPNIKMHLEIKAVAASMGSAIAASPVWDDISVESTSMFMIHNPSGVAFGDYRLMLENADFLRRARDMWAGVYAAKSGDTIEETQGIMDTETWYFGQEIIDAGFADKMNELESEGAGDPDKNMVMLQMKTEFSSMSKRQKIIESEEGFDVQKAVACLGMQAPKKDDDDTAEGGSHKPVPEGENKTEVSMKDKAELKEKAPAIYDESVLDGVMQERARVKMLTDLKKQDEYKDIPEVCEAIDKAVEDGKSLEETNTLMMAAMVKIKNDPGQIEGEESPGDIETGETSEATMQAGTIKEV